MLHQREIKQYFLMTSYLQHNFNLFAISETWFGCEPTNDIHINSILPDGYMMHHVDRNSERRGGGISLIYKMCLEPMLLPHGSSMYIVIIYYFV